MRDRLTYNRQWREKNKARINAEARAKRAADPDRFRGYDRKYYYADPDRRRAKSRKSVYGLTAAEWDALFTSQGKACAICRATEPGGNRPWHTDHCHKTRRVRGILCKACNIGIGHLKDNSALLRRAAEYVDA